MLGEHAGACVCHVDAEYRQLIHSTVLSAVTITVSLQNMGRKLLPHLSARKACTCHGLIMVTDKVHMVERGTYRGEITCPSTGLSLCTSISGVH